jgi:hypothetical protein
LRTSRWKYAVVADAETAGRPHASQYREMCLYDLRADPYELQNLIDSAPHEPVRQEFQRLLIHRMEATGEPAATILPAASEERSSQRTVDYPNESNATVPGLMETPPAGRLQVMRKPLHAS